MRHTGSITEPTESGQPSLGDCFKIFGKIGLLSFGGPTAQIALMHRVLVDERKWLSEQQYLNALGFCMLLPGPEAMQLATYAGWRLHRFWGGLMAGLLFVLPGAALVLALAVGYAAFGNIPSVKAVFVGIQAAVLIIVIEAMLRISKRALKRTAHWWIAAASFLGLFFFAAPFPVIIAVAACIGLFVLHEEPQAVEDTPVRVSIARTTGTVAVWLIVWFAPLAVAALLLGTGHVLTEIGVFFSKLAVVTFGGAYAVLAYMAQEVVQGFGWLTASEMLEALGLAETTNGPLILVTEFVAYVAAYRAGDASVAIGLMGAAMALWVTFTPCFLWIFAGAPYVERLRSNVRIAGALSSITAAVVGVIANLSVWFALHVFFGSVVEQHFGVLRIWWPDLLSVNPLPIVLSIICALTLLRLHLGLAWTLAIAGGLAFGWHMVTV